MCAPRLMRAPWRNSIPADRRLIEGKDLEETHGSRNSARQTGLSDKAVESRLVRLRRQLRERLRGHVVNKVDVP